MFEKTAINERGEVVQIVLCQSRETQQSTLSIGVDQSGDPRLTGEEQAAFSTENENPFAGVQAPLKQTGVFIDRFFHGSTYEDLADQIRHDRRERPQDLSQRGQPTSGGHRSHGHRGGAHQTGGLLETEG